MNQIKIKKVEYLNHFERKNHSKKLSIGLFFIALIACPLFSVLFYVSSAPASIVQIIFSGTVVFPVFILIQNFSTRFKHKLPYLFFAYFLAVTYYDAYTLYQQNFNVYHFVFFIGIFATLNAALERFWLSIFYILSTLLFLTILFLNCPSPEMNMEPGLVFIAAIGIFYATMYYNRNMIISKIKDYNQYLRLIVNNPGNGFVLMREKTFKVIDFNEEALKILNVADGHFLQEKLGEIFKSDQNRISDEYFQFKVKEGAEEKIIEIKTIPLHLNTGNYLQTTIMDVSQKIKKQNELSFEVLRAEIAEDNNKILSNEIEERIKVEQKLQEAYLRTKAIFDSSSNTLLLTLTPDLNFSSFNSHCKQYFEMQTDIEFKEGLHFETYFNNLFTEAYMRYFRLVMRKVKRGRSFQLEINFKSHKGMRIWLEVFVNPIADIFGRISEISLVCHDITEKKKNEKEIIQSLKEKEILLKEVHHRVKNNLQIISSILNLQSNHTMDENILSILNESRDRVRTMAIIHENLYRTNNFSSLNFSTYVKELTHNLIASYQYNKELIIELAFDISEVELILDQAIPCGLIINEIITNSIKYAFIGRKDGKISISMQERNNRIFIEVSDNGCGFEQKNDYFESDSLGIQLIITLVEQLDGNITLDNSQGIKYLINFEKEKN